MLPLKMETRQIRLYQHRVNVWRKEAKTFDAKGKPSADVWKLISKNIRCLFVPKSKFAEVLAGAGRVDPASRRTNQEIHFVLGQDVRQGDILVNVTLDRFGRKVPGYYGTFYATLGLPEDVPSVGNRRANYRGFEIQQQEKPPTGITV